MEKRIIPVFSTTQRFVHWLIVVAFSLLVLTGMVLYVPQLGPLAQGEAGMLLRQLHRWGVICAVLATLTYIIFDFRGLVASMTEIFTWGKDDVGWLRAAPTYYFFGDESDMPPQSKFNTGQKLWYLIVVIGGLGLFITGLLMWFGKGFVPRWLFQWSVFFHDLFAIAMSAFFLVHFYLAVAHPLMRAGLDAMRFGFFPEVYVMRHHAKWYRAKWYGMHERITTQASEKRRVGEHLATDAES
jgi:formate dehydrogenase subunit gamma